MLQIIATIILIGSLIGIGLILYRKIPKLRKLKVPKEEKALKTTLKKLRSKIKSSRCFQPDFFENFLQKVLSRIKILTMKIENRISEHLQKLRERAQKRRGMAEDKYWRKIKKSIKSERKKKK